MFLSASTHLSWPRREQHQGIHAGEGDNLEPVGDPLQERQKQKGDSIIRQDTPCREEKEDEREKRIT